MKVRVHGRTVDGQAVVGFRYGRMWGGWWGRVELAGGRSKCVASSANEESVIAWMAAQLDPEVAVELATGAGA